MTTFKRFEEIECWQLARELDKEIYEKTVRKDFARDFKLKDQILGASGSAMDNIAEGFGRDGNKEFVQFLSVSKASSEEIKSQLYRALDREYITKEEFETLFKKNARVIKKNQQPDGLPDAFRNKRH